MITFTFADNQEPQENGRWFDQVRKRFEIEEENFTKTKTPGDTIAIDESMVPWRDRLLFRQNNPGQAQKYEVKIYKLNDPERYTSSVYIGKMLWPTNRDHHP